MINMVVKSWTLISLVKTSMFCHLLLGKIRSWPIDTYIHLLCRNSCLNTCFTNRTINRSSFLCLVIKLKFNILVVKFPRSEIFCLLVTKLLHLKKKKKQNIACKKVFQYGIKLLMLHIHVNTIYTPMC